MNKPYLRKFAIVAAFVLMLAMTLGATFYSVDARLFYPSVSYAVEDAQSASTDYYATIEALGDDVNGSEFRQSLANLITTTHTTLTTYDGLRDVYKKSDSLEDGYITWFFTGTTSKYNGVMGSAQGSTNREHVWPKKAGQAYEDQKSNVGSDAHHLRPVEGTFNSSHNDSQFDEVEEIVANIIAENGTINYSNLCYASDGSFMPGVGYRGATARILMYVQTRWGDNYKDDSGCGLKFTTETDNTNPKLIGNIATLIKWHLEEPPTEEEKTRNEEVYKIQGNRNPFIDHPEYAERIYCYDGEDYNEELQEVVEQNSGDEAIESITLNKTDATTHVGERVFLSADLMPSNAIRDLKWESTNTAVATVDSTGIVTPISAGTTEITVYSKSNPTKKSTCTITVVALSSISIEGTPTVTEYQAGFAFDPTGLQVTATYTNNSTSDVTAQCQWLDATTRQTTLSSGTTSVICKYQDKEATIDGITVTGGTTHTVKITPASSSDIGTKYNWYHWSQNGISGELFGVKANSSNGNGLQFNNDGGKRACYIFNTTPLPGKLISIKITLSSAVTQDNRTFAIYTSNTPYSESSTIPTTGTNHDTKEVTINGTSWNLNTTDKYFTINFTSAKKAVYLESIEIVYEECTEHQYGEWITTKEPTATESGEKSHSCINCGYTETETIDALGTSGGDGNQGGNTGEGNTPDDTYTVEDFKNAVEAVKNASTPEEIQEAITYAESVYNSLNSRDKSSAEVENAYIELGAQRKALQDLLGDDSSALSVGAIVGIVIACVAVATILTVVVIFVIKSKRNKLISDEYTQE